MVQVVVLFVRRRARKGGKSRKVDKSGKRLLLKSAFQQDHKSPLYSIQLPPTVCASYGSYFVVVGKIVSPCADAKLLRRAME